MGRDEFSNAASKNFRAGFSPLAVGRDTTIRSDTGPIIDNTLSGEPTFSNHMAPSVALGFDERAIQTFCDSAK